MSAAAIPPWILPDAWQQLTPPAIVLKLGELPRAPDKVLSASRSLHVTLAKRYQPDATGTKCNIYLSDVLMILAAPIPHDFDMGDGRGKREIVANDIVDGLHKSLFGDWRVYGPAEAASRAAAGFPTIAVWKNTAPRKDTSGRIITQKGRPLFHPGHVVLVVPAPAGASGLYVTGAGAHCIESCPISWAFGNATPVEIYSHD